MSMPRKTATQLAREIEEELAKARAIWNRKPAETTDEAWDNEYKKRGLCVYCGKPTRKGSALIEGWCAHKSCIDEFEDQ